MADLHDQIPNSVPIIPGHQSILDRLARIEASLGIGEIEDDHSGEVDVEEPSDQTPGVYRAIARLRLITRPAPDEVVWSRPVVEQLWNSYVCFFR